MIDINKFYDYWENEIKSGKYKNINILNNQYENAIRIYIKTSHTIFKFDNLGMLTPEGYFCSENVVIPSLMEGNIIEFPDKYEWEKDYSDEIDYDILIKNILCLALIEKYDDYLLMKEEFETLANVVEEYCDEKDFVQEIKNSMKEMNING